MGLWGLQHEFLHGVLRADIPKSQPASEPHLKMYFLAVIWITIAKAYFGGPYRDFRVDINELQTV